MVVRDVQLTYRFARIPSCPQSMQYGVKRDRIEQASKIAEPRLPRKEKQSKRDNALKRLKEKMRKHADGSKGEDVKVKKQEL